MLFAHPQYLTYLGLAFVAFPSVPINRLAWLVIAAWLPGQFVWMTQFPAAPIDMAMDILAVGIGAALARSFADMFVTAVFVPMAAVNMADGIGSIHPYYAWWILFALAMMQIAAIPFGNDWSKLGKLLKKLRHGLA